MNAARLPSLGISDRFSTRTPRSTCRAPHLNFKSSRLPGESRGHEVVRSCIPVKGVGMKHEACTSPVHTKRTVFQNLRHRHICGEANRVSTVDKLQPKEINAHDVREGANSQSMPCEPCKFSRRTTSNEHQRKSIY